MGMTVTPDQIATAMKNHVVSKKSAADEIVDVVVKPKASAKRFAKNKYVPGVKNQQCKFCNGFFEKVNLHSPYCKSNPKRRAGHRAAMQPKQNKYMANEIAVYIFEGKSIRFVMDNLSKFNEWVALTEELLNSK